MQHDTSQKISNVSDQTRSETVEGRLAWWNELSTGVGLVVGYVLYSLYWIITPETLVQIDFTKPTYENIVIGRIPQSTIFEFIPSEQDIRSISEYKDVRIDSPKFKNGAPVMETITESFSGLGDPVIEIRTFEILTPKLGDPDYHYTVQDIAIKGFSVNFSPNIYYSGENVFYQQKVVVFPDRNSADAFAVRVATGFSILSLLLFFIRARKRASLWFLNLLNIEEDYESD